jgi:Clp amino terminal domain, pathogenicity island component
MFERFTDQARRVVVLAQEEARMINHNYIGTEHVLLGLLREEEGIGARALVALGISLQRVRGAVIELIGEGIQAPSGHIPFTPRAKKVLELSLREALQLGHTDIGTEHILLGLIREGEGVAAQVLVDHGAGLDRVRQEVLRLVAEEGEQRASAPGARTIHAMRVAPGQPELAAASFGEDAQRALRLAAAVAGWLGEGRPVGQTDLLWGLIRGAGPELSALLEELGVDLEAARHRLSRMMAEEPAVEVQGEPSGGAYEAGSAEFGGSEEAGEAGR